MAFACRNAGLAGLGGCFGVAHFPRSSCLRLWPSSVRPDEGFSPGGALVLLQPRAREPNHTWHALLLDYLKGLDSGQSAAWDSPQLGTSCSFRIARSLGQPQLEISCRFGTARNFGQPTTVGTARKQGTFYNCGGPWRKPPARGHPKG
eukprot:29588-Chlamydomonas_euryale.AAC.1